VVGVGAFCNFGVSDTGSPVHFLGFFGILRQILEIRGWYNIDWGLRVEVWMLVDLWGFGVINEMGCVSYVIEPVH